VKIALFVDFDNVYSGLRRISAEAAERFSRQPLLWLHWLTQGVEGSDADESTVLSRRALVRRCYLNPVMYQKYRRPFHEAGFEIVDCPPMTATGKTSTDIHLVLDVMDALADRTHFDEFVVFSADADFSPVLRRLRRHDRRTVVFAAGAMSESYKASADRVIDIPTFLQEALQLSSMEDSEPPLKEEISQVSRHFDAFRNRVADRIRDLVTQAEAPVPLKTLVQQLRQEFAQLSDGRWDGAATFDNLMRELNINGVVFDFENEVARDFRRMSRTGLVPDGRTPRQQVSIEHEEAWKHDRPLEQIPQESLEQAATTVIRNAVASSRDPLQLSALGIILRQRLPQLKGGWGSAPNLAAFLRQLNIEPIRRAVLEDGTTNVLYDPGRHDEPTGAVGDRLVASMLSAAELPTIKGADLNRILSTARPYMGGTDHFEIAEVSRNIAAKMSTEGRSISPRRITTVLQPLIFGGLDTTKPYLDINELLVDAMGVIISAWAREMQTQPDDEARNRLIAWLRGSS